MQQRSAEIAIQLKNLIALIKDSGQAGKESLVSFEAQRSSVQAMTNSLDEIATVMSELNLKSGEILSVMGA